MLFVQILGFKKVPFSNMIKYIIVLEKKFNNVLGSV
jgi:hypothetical protein